MLCIPFPTERLMRQNGKERARSIVTLGKPFRSIDKLGVSTSCAMSTEKRVTVATLPRAYATGRLQSFPFAKVQRGWGVDGVDEAKQNGVQQAAAS